LFYDRSPGLHGLNQMLQAARRPGKGSSISRPPRERNSGRGGAPIAGPRARLRFATKRRLGYHPNEFVLRHISRPRRPGEMVALAGPTGAGTSTLVNLLPA